MNKIKPDGYKVLNVNASNLTTLIDKGLKNYLVMLYNPNNFFKEVHILTGNPNDLNVKLDKTIKVHLIKKFNFFPIDLPYSIIKLCGLVRKNKLDIIRARGPMLPGLQAVITGKLTNTPVVVSLGGNMRLAQKLLNKYEMRYKFLTELTEVFSIKNADIVICYNNFTRDYCINLGVDPRKIRVVPMRTDMSLFNPKTDGSRIKKELGIENERIILFVGKMELDKQIDSMIECMPYVVSKIPNAKFVYIGSGSIKSQIIQRVAEMGMEENAIFKDYEPSERVAQYMAASDTVVVPMSVFVILEAAASAKPIIAYDVEWHSEFIENGVTGILVENRNHIELAKEIVRVLQDGTLAKIIGSNARNKIEKEYQKSELYEINVSKELLKS